MAAPPYQQSPFYPPYQQQGSSIQTTIKTPPKTPPRSVQYNHNNNSMMDVAAAPQYTNPFHSLYPSANHNGISSSSSINIHSSNSNSNSNHINNTSSTPNSTPFTSSSTNLLNLSEFIADHVLQLPLSLLSSHFLFHPSPTAMYRDFMIDLLQRVMRATSVEPATALLALRIAERVVRRGMDCVVLQQKQLEQHRGVLLGAEVRGVEPLKRDLDAEDRWDDWVASRLASARANGGGAAAVASGGIGMGGSVTAARHQTSATADPTALIQKELGRMDHKLLYVHYTSLLHLFHPSPLSSLSPHQNRPEHRLYLTALMLADSYLNDNAFLCKSWSQVSGLGVGECVGMRRCMLECLDHEIARGRDGEGVEGREDVGGLVAAFELSILGTKGGANSVNAANVANVGVSNAVVSSNASSNAVAANVRGDIGFAQNHQQQQHQQQPHHQQQQSHYHYQTPLHQRYYTPPPAAAAAAPSSYIDAHQPFQYHPQPFHQPYHQPYQNHVVPTQIPNQPRASLDATRRVSAGWSYVQPLQQPPMQVPSQYYYGGVAGKERPVSFPAYQQLQQQRGIGMGGKKVVVSPPSSPVRCPGAKGARGGVQNRKVEGADFVGVFEAVTKNMDFACE
ncbi:hypothetical protein HDU97_000310 [Phlyctochytrium planicorne]|nr:hypothetical protein HDU97_000310 [Phlyctochytrium planicorne]